MLYFASNISGDVIRVDPSGAALSINCGAAGTKGLEFQDAYIQNQARGEMNC